MPTTVPHYVLVTCFFSTGIFVQKNQIPGIVEPAEIDFKVFTDMKIFFKSFSR
jgi:hypothetical protein